MYPADRYGLPKTDLKKWRLVTDEYGKQNWVYARTEAEEAAIPPTQFTRYQLGNEFHPPQFPKPKTAKEAATNCFRFLSLLQDESGIFPCQYGGPMFMLIGYVVAKYFCGVPFSPEESIEICRYIVNRAHPVDGGWGLHTYGDSTAFGTTINYVILRILGMDADHPAVAKARKTLHNLGGAIGNPMWGKAYLSLLNLYEWEGVNPSPPEFWMLPYWLPIHPGRWWVHTRAIYLPMGYLAARRAKMDLNPLLKELRTELYTRPYETIDFSKHRNTVCGVDLYYPHSSLLNIMNQGMVWYEKYLRPDWLKRRSLKYAASLVEADLENTDWLAIAPVSNALNAIVMFLEHGRNSPMFERFLFRWPDFLYMTPEGMFMCGTNGVQVWDVAFAVQYCVIAGLADKAEFHDTIIRAYRFLVRSQFTDETVPGSFRDKRIGGWPFSTKPQGFIVSDCTAEAIKALIMVQNVPGLEFLKAEISEERLYQGIDRLLAMQNPTGSFATYEIIKGPSWMESLNPAEVFGNIMVEYPYVECTDSSILGLQYFMSHYDYRHDDIRRTVDKAIEYILSYQRSDGSWYGSWGVCHTYAGMFAIEALSTQNLTWKNCEAVRKACDFIVRRQEPDGGWAEDFRSCELFSFVRHNKSEPVQTAWATIMLLLAEYPDRAVLDRAIKFLMDKQNPDGSYNHNHVEGVFNHSCAIEYPNYKFYFTMKALGLYSRKFEND